MHTWTWKQDDGKREQSFVGISDVKYSCWLCSGFLLSDFSSFRFLCVFYTSSNSNIFRVRYTQPLSRSTCITWVSAVHKPFCRYRTMTTTTTTEEERKRERKKKRAGHLVNNILKILQSKCCRVALINCSCLEGMSCEQYSLEDNGFMSSRKSNVWWFHADSVRIMLLIFFPVPTMSHKNNENFIFEAHIRWHRECTREGALFQGHSALGMIPFRFVLDRSKALGFPDSKIRGTSSHELSVIVFLKSTVRW